MACMKCGRKTAGAQAFCEECLARADQYPVDPAEPIILHPRKAEVPTKKKHGQKRFQRSPEEQVVRLRAVSRRLAVLLCLSLLALGLAVAALLHMINLF